MIQRLRDRLLQRLFAILAMLALLFASAAPTLSHAMAAAGHEGWVQVCTAQGMRWVALEADAQTPQPPPATAAQLEHCPVCSLAGQPLACPPAAPLPLPAPSGRIGPPERFEQSPRTAHVWVSAQPRAPPGA